MTSYFHFIDSTKPRKMQDSSRRIRNSSIDSWICTLSLEEDKIAV